jgi:hypothetical protein
VSSHRIALQLDGGDTPRIRIAENDTADGSVIALSFGTAVVTYHSDHSPAGAVDEFCDWLHALAVAVEVNGAKL